MYDIETIHVTSDARVKKTFSIGWGGGVPMFLGEETVKRGEEKGTEGLGLRALEIEWRSFRPRICDCFYCARGRGNHLQAPAVRPNARYSLAWGSWSPRSPNARDLGHPHLLLMRTCATCQSRLSAPGPNFVIYDRRRL